MENALNIVMLSEMGGCTIIICFLEYGILQVQNCLNYNDSDHKAFSLFYNVHT